MGEATTNISDLPEVQVSNPSNPSYQRGTQKVRNNIVLETKELGALNSSAQLSPQQMEQLRQQLQNGSQNGGTDLPSRDIPMQTSHLVQDPTVQANYVPPPPKNVNDYIKEEAMREAILREQQPIKEENKEDKIYEELQMPIFVMILFFIFQMPFVRRLMKKYIPTLFLTDNNLTLGGYMFLTVLFGTTFFGVQKLINYVAEWNTKINQFFEQKSSM
jgi:hypothetical protein